MDLNFTAEEEAFRTEVLDFLRTSLPESVAARMLAGKRLTRDELMQWHHTLNQKGWLANHWPKEYGGPGWTPVQKFIFENECAIAGAPRVVPFGVNMLGPVLIKYGSEAQRQYWLPRILNGEDWWCQGYSEPGAGSDLASLRTTAVRTTIDGKDYYVVNGQKTWTTYGQYANMIFCLVRTSKDVSKQSGISFLLIDLNTPGIEMRPIITLDGEHEVNEVFFTDVKVPADNLVGEEDKGWTYAKYLLTYERTNIAGVGFSMAELHRLKTIAQKIRSDGRDIIDDPLFAARLARVEIDLENMKTTNLRVIAAVAGGGVPGAESSMLKIRGTEIRQELSSLLRRAMGPYAQLEADEAVQTPGGIMPAGIDEAAGAAAQYFNLRKLSIFGGSNEIQKNIISKMILGL
ncbi:acyl-CoA dehydrogenase family protein [Paraburkholderia adhaesiva]|uniref:acyl-CoA dehydrogenase family protein n=1 Tax=Paraburkholderia adhaesiva TaxID=2883244 RepID=UPI001F240337|nr:acyl-CoA dehydrogenase family protein [Paraburkholderia adhaesiva]